MKVMYAKKRLKVCLLKLKLCTYFFEENQGYFSYYPKILITFAVLFTQK